VKGRERRRGERREKEGEGRRGKEREGGAEENRRPEGRRGSQSLARTKQMQTDEMSSLLKSCMIEVAYSSPFSEGVDQRGSH
jgi:hypothetical protein